MRPIDADALTEELNSRIEAAIKWGVNAIADRDAEIKLRAEQAVATFCEASLTVKKMPTISPKTGYIEFADWVAEEVMREDFGDSFFAEVACRKLYRLGIIEIDGEKWKLEEVTE